MQKDEFVYTVLLGFRLFLSPRQLLTELNRLAREDATSPTFRKSFAANECPKCGRKQRKILEVKSSKKALLEEPSGDGSEPKRIVSMLFPAASSHQDGEDTLRRKRRRRFQSDSHPEENTPPEKMDCSFSQDSRVLSAFLENEDTESKPSINNNSSAPFSSNLRDAYCAKCAALSKSENTLVRKKQLVHILLDWVRHFPADFRNKKISWALNDVIRSCQSENEVSFQTFVHSYVFVQIKTT